MRNLKKVLSLALALVMLLGMMVVGASAAYSDEASIGGDYKEAVDVLTAIKVVQGRTATAFQPERTLTRAEAATIIVRALLGRTVADALAKNTNSVVFSDMQGHWAAGVVDYCYDRGIIRGTSATTFSPDRTVSSLEYTAMVLRALGLVDADNAAGGNWMTETIAVAAQKGLSDSTLVVSNARMKRQEAAQMAFNGILYSPSGEKTYKVGNETFSSAADAYFYQQGLKGDKPAIEVVTAKDSLAATVHNLTSGTKDDGFGHTVKTWNVDGKEVWAASTYTTTADIVIENQAEDTAKTIENKTLKDLTVSYATDAHVYVDGEKDPTGKTKADLDTKAKIAALCANNNVVEIYLDSAKKITKIIVVNTYAGLVTVNPANEKKETARSITIQGDTTVNNLETEDWEKDQVVLYNKSYVSGEDTTPYNIKNVAAAGSVTGTLTRVSNDNKTFTVSGTAYGFSDQAVKGTTKGSVKDDFLGKADQIFYLDAAGKNIVYVTAADGQTTAIKDYAMILDADVVKGSSFGKVSCTLKVKALLSDGTIGTYEVTMAAGGSSNDGDTGDFVVVLEGDDKIVYDSSEDSSKDNAALSTAAKALLEPNVFTYTLKDGKMTLKAALATAQGATEDGTYASKIVNNETIKKSSASVKIGTNTAVVLNNNTAFVLTADKKTASPKVGTAALGGTEISTDGTDNKVIYVVAERTNGLNVATCVFAIGVEDVAAKTGDYVYVDKTYNIGKDVDGNSVYYYTGITPDGDEIEVTTDAVDKGEGIFTYDTDNELGDAPSGVGSGTVTAVSGTTVVINDSTYLTTNDDTKIVSVDGRTDLEKDAKVFYVAKDGVIVTVYVTGVAST